MSNLQEKVTQALRTWHEKHTIGGIRYVILFESDWDELRCTLASANDLLLGRKDDETKDS